MNKIYRYAVRLLIEDFQEANQQIAKIFVFHVASKNSDSEDLYIYIYIYNEEIFFSWKTFFQRNKIDPKIFITLRTKFLSFLLSRDQLTVLII